MPTTHTVSGRFSNGASSSRGKLSFFPTEASRHEQDGIILSTEEIDVDLDSNGQFSVELYATDDAGWSNTFKWIVRERIIGGATHTYVFDLTADLNLASVDTSQAV